MGGVSAINGGTFGINSGVTPTSSDFTVPSIDGKYSTITVDNTAKTVTVTYTDIPFPKTDGTWYRIKNIGKNMVMYPAHRSGTTSNDGTEYAYYIAASAEAENTTDEQQLWKFEDVTGATISGSSKQVYIKNAISSAYLSTRDTYNNADNLLGTDTQLVGYVSMDADADNTQIATPATFILTYVPASGTNSAGFYLTNKRYTTNPVDINSSSQIIINSSINTSSTLDNNERWLLESVDPTYTVTLTPTSFQVASYLKNGATIYNPIYRTVHNPSTTNCYWIDGSGNGFTFSSSAPSNIGSAYGQIDYFDYWSTSTFSHYNENDFTYYATADNNSKITLTRVGAWGDNWWAQNTYLLPSDNIVLVGLESHVFRFFDCGTKSLTLRHSNAEYSTDGSTAVTNMLTFLATGTDVTSSQNYYFLAYKKNIDTEKPKFYLAGDALNPGTSTDHYTVKAASFTIGGSMNGQVVFHNPNATSPVKSMELGLFGDTGAIATGIEPVKAGNATSNDVYYDLQGRAIMHPSKGLYIKNGKKIIIK